MLIIFVSQSFFSKNKVYYGSQHLLYLIILSIRRGQISFNQIMTSINESFVTDDEIIKDQNIIAFIPPVSGG
ncbi:MoaD/ThiS family protein [Peribacillus butanolivorans]|uniref:MoaD/ThiS family protein n=1 Tax=Peribacillus butanolivorans TaxID=421767 RepID=UPI002E21F00B